MSFCKVKQHRSQDYRQHCCHDQVRQLLMDNGAAVHNACAELQHSSHRRPMYLSAVHHVYLSCRTNKVWSQGSCPVTLWHLCAALLYPATCPVSQCQHAKRPVVHEKNQLSTCEQFTCLWGKARTCPLFVTYIHAFVTL